MDCTTNFCGCGNQYPIVPGSNPSLVTWDGQKFVVADGAKQLPINLPYIQHTSISNVVSLIGATKQGVLSKLRYFGNFIINYLLIGGGGASGDSFDGNGSGGGGAGGVLQSSFSISSGKIINVIVGLGGIVQGNNQAGGNGENSIINYLSNSITSIGGGGGSGDITPYLNGKNGGSGGGSGTNGFTVGTIGIGVVGQGYNGGVSNLTTGNSGGGGGGAGGVGGSPFIDGNGDNNGGAGGNGIASSITGISIYYAAGGGGNAIDISGTNGLGWPNYGSGGNALYQGSPGMNGFGGVCILSIPTEYFSGAYTNATVTINGANTILTFTQNGTYTT